MNTNTSNLVITAIVNPAHAAELPDYLGKVMQVFGQHGGQPVGLYKTAEALAGEHTPQMISIMAFPSAQVIKDMVAGEAFQALADQRARVFSQLHLLLCEAQ